MLNPKATPPSPYFHTFWWYLLKCFAIECDELGTFIYKKQRQLSERDRKENPEFGDAYAFIALDSGSKAVVTSAIGKRDMRTMSTFIDDLRGRLTGRIQISTDGIAHNREAIKSAFGNNVDYSQIIGNYASEHSGPGRDNPPRVSTVAITRVFCRSNNV